MNIADAVRRAIEDGKAILTAEALAGLKDKKILEIRIDESAMRIILRLADEEIAISPFATCKC